MPAKIKQEKTQEEFRREDCNETEYNDTGIAKKRKNKKGGAVQEPER